MSQLDELARLAASLTLAETFDACAWQTLRTANTLVREALAADGRGRVCRTLLHLRRESYQALRAVDAETDTERLEGVESSASIWASVRENHCSISVDVAFGGVMAHMADGDRIIPTSTFDSGSTQKSLLARATTHLYAIPLLTQADRLHGMLLVEVQAPDAAVQPIVHAHCGQALALLASITLPHLLRLRDERTLMVRASIDTVTADLPVMGERTRRALPLLRLFAESEGTILLTGPTGTGKSTLAEWCHAQSPRAAGPFETVLLNALPEQMQLAELFGWRKGAFTGATTDREGAVFRAEGGTLFIDEIDKLSVTVQGALLRLLQERNYRPLAGVKERTANVRIIAASNQVLPDLIRDGLFLEDLYHRLNLFPFELEPLAVRRDEIEPWARHMAHQCHAGYLGERRRLRIEDTALAALPKRDWPGNLRQLDNVVRRAYMVARAAASDDEGCTLTLRPEHLEWSLTLERPLASRPMVALLTEAAASVARRAIERYEYEKEPLPLELLDGFKGMCLQVARRETGKLTEAFRVFGQASLVAHRNHHKSWNQLSQRATELQAAFEPRG